ncbi:hypothetical protein JXA70_05180 [candidate division KSB1 bacterium]|nr:hypothetical protein [candidate division KSB1 bacterium]
MSLIGLDIGTTGCKAIIFDVTGRIIGQASREYPVLFPKPDWAEQDAETVYGLAIEALQEAVSFTHADPPVALAISCQGEAVMPVDAQGNPLRPVILGMDRRTRAENIWLADKFGAETLFERTGMPMHTINTLPKLLWLKKNTPDLWSIAEQFTLYEDFFVRRFTGKAVISHCLASRTQMYDIHKGEWASDILEACGIELARLAPLASPDGVIGTIKQDVLQQLGLSRDVLVVAGGHDQACAALGSGVVHPGMAMVSTGTAEVVEVASDAPVLAPALRDGGISIYKHVVPGLFLAMTLNHSGGLSLRWFRDNFAEKEQELARAQGSDAYDLILKKARPGATDLFVLPHFSGSGTPLLDTTSKCAIIGITFETNKSDIAKAILEGLTFELKANLDLLRSCGIPIQSMHAVGGGAKSALWLQLKADICDVTIRVPFITEAACLGAALIAGVGAGLFADYKSAAQQIVTFDRSCHPSTNERDGYAERYKLYQKIYPALKHIHANNKQEIIP